MVKMTSQIRSARRSDLDWLRVMGVLLLVPFQAALIFNLNPNAIMYIKDTVNSEFLGRLTWFISRFFMPLLFCISGAATCLALGFRSAGQYLGERVKRLLIPSVLGIVVLIPPMTFITGWSHGSTLSFWQHYLHLFTFNLNDLSGMYGTFTPAHIWFIIFLFIYSVVALPLFLLEKR